jgi:hypothetical protein
MRDALQQCWLEWMTILSMCPQELRAEYGSDPVGFYATDAFNENVPPSDDPDFLRASSAAVFGVRRQWQWHSMQHLVIKRIYIVPPNERSPGLASVSAVPSAMGFVTVVAGVCV